MNANFCKKEQLGTFILDTPSSVNVNDTSFWTARVKLPASTPGGRAEGNLDTNASTNGLWNNPAGNPTPPPSPYTSPWRRHALSRPLEARENLNPSPSGIYEYAAGHPIHYLVRKTGYYCVAIVPVTVQSKRADTDVPFHPSYSGTVFFQNTFRGQLPATDYPKVNVRTSSIKTCSCTHPSRSSTYVCSLPTQFSAEFGAGCATSTRLSSFPSKSVCSSSRRKRVLTSHQYYLSGLVGLLVIEMVANWGQFQTILQSSNLIYFQPTTVTSTHMARAPRQPFSSLSLPFSTLAETLCLSSCFS